VCETQQALTNNDVCFGHWFDRRGRVETTLDTFIRPVFYLFGLRSTEEHVNVAASVKVASLLHKSRTVIRVGKQTRAMACTHTPFKLFLLGKARDSTV